jgi:hypothetical protein
MAVDGHDSSTAFSTLERTVYSMLEERGTRIHMHAYCRGDWDEKLATAASGKRLNYSYA